MSHRIRAMRRADLGRVEAIYRQYAPEAPPADSLSTAHEAIDGGGEAPLALVAEAARGRVLGYIVGAVRSWEFGSKPAGWVIGIGVDVEHQKERVGGELLSALVASFAARGTTTVRTMVRRDDVQVLRFFRGAGFAMGPYSELEMEVKP
jgi:ribosomal protein S18 acetylase RimI-like enzyme